MNAVAMTFDDGPDERWTPALLDALEALGARASFFVIAPRAAAHHDLIERMLAEGHAVGLHCGTHVRHSARDRDWVAADTEQALDRLDRLGVTPTLWRTPWGDTAPWTAELAESHGLRLIHWSVDSHDWRGDSASAMFSATQSQLKPGAVVLAHDGIGPGAQREGAAETVAYLELVARHTEDNELALQALT
jgi:peptidoglycan/xylan/chitin deacetylase (PgdA/CDA1 family)